MYRTIDAVLAGSASQFELSSVQSSFAAASSLALQRERQAAYAVFAGPAAVLLVRRAHLNSVADFQVYLPLLIATFRVGFIPALCDNAGLESPDSAADGLKLVHLERVGNHPTRRDQLRCLQVLRRNVAVVTAAMLAWAIALTLSGAFRAAHSDRPVTSTQRCASPPLDVSHGPARTSSLR